MGRRFTLDVAGSARGAEETAHPSALDLLVSALVADLLSRFDRESARAGVTIHDAELSVSATLDNPLVALGVVGETGSAALASITGSLYVSAEADPGVLGAIWSAARERSPVDATLRRSVDLRIELKPQA